MFKLKKNIASKIKSIINFIQSENSITDKSKCIISPSVILTATQINGTVTINEKSEIANSKLLGDIKVCEQVTIKDATISGKITIDEKSKIVDGVELYGEIEIGKFTTINGPNTDLRCVLNKISIGNFCSIARNVTFQEYNHDFNRLTSYFVNANIKKTSMKEDIVSKGAISIGHDVWIGTHSVILSGVTIATGVVVAANSVVVSDIPPYAIVAGSPAKIIKYRFSDSTIAELLESKWWEKSTEEIVKLYDAFGSK